MATLPADVDIAALSSLMGMGFTEAPCRHALTVCSNDVNRAVEYLFNTGGQEQEVVDMTMSPDLDHHDVWEWTKVRTTYADSQQIVFVDCAVALELAADHLEYYDKQGNLGDLADVECIEHLSDDDNLSHPTAAPREKRPSLEHTVTFVKDHLDVMRSFSLAPSLSVCVDEEGVGAAGDDTTQLTIICVNPGCWISMPKYHNSQKEVVSNIKRILLAACRIVHVQLKTGDTRHWGKQLQILLSIRNKWYAGQDGEQGMMSHRRLVLEQVFKQDTLRMLIQRAESLLLQPEVTLEEQQMEAHAEKPALVAERQTRAGSLPSYLQDVQRILECLFSSPDLHLGDDWADRGHSVLRDFVSQLRTAGDLPVVRRTAIALTLLSSLQWLGLQMTRCVFDEVAQWLDEVDLKASNAISTQQMEALADQLAACAFAPALMGHLRVYEAWLHVAGLLWRSPSLARHLAAIVALDQIADRVMQQGMEHGPAVNTKYMLSEREFQVLADRGLDRYDILYTDTNELVEGAEMTFEHTVTRPVPPCVLTHEALLAWVDQLQLIDQLFGAKRHQQLLTNETTRRLLGYLSNMEALQAPHLASMLRAVCRAHETERVEIEQLLLHVLPELNEAAQATLLDSAAAMLPPELLAQLLTRRPVSWWSLHVGDKPRTTLLNSLWNLMVDHTPNPDSHTAADAAGAAAALARRPSFATLPPLPPSADLSPSPMNQSTRKRPPSPENENSSPMGAGRPSPARRNGKNDSAGAVQMETSSLYSPSVDSINPPPPHTSPAPARQAVPAAVVAATATPRMPSKGLCELFAKLLRPEEQQRYLLLCLQLLRRATEARWPVRSSPDAVAASPDAHQLRQAMAAKLSHTEQTLEVLRHVLQATDARHIPSLNDVAESMTTATASTTTRAPHDPGGGGGEGQAAQPRRRRKRAQPQRASSPRGSLVDLTESDSDDRDAAIPTETTNRSMSSPQGQLEDIEAEADEATDEWCDGSFHQKLVELVLAEMGGWVPAARRSSLSTATPVPPRLRFLSFLMALWAKLWDSDTDDAELLGVQLVERLWALLLVHDVAGESSVSLLDWLRQVTPYMSVRTRAHVFSKLLCPLMLASGSEGRVDEDTTTGMPPPPPPPLPNVTASALRCFTHFFVSCNATLGALEADVRRSPCAERRPPVRRVIQLEALQGLDALWSFVLRCPDVTVAATAIQFLHLLYRSSDPPHHNNHRLSPDCSDAEDHMPADAPPVRSGALQLCHLVFEMLRGMSGDHTAATAASAAVLGSGGVQAQQPGASAITPESDGMRLRRCHRALLVLQTLLQVDFTRKLAAHRDGGVGRTFQLHVVPGAGLTVHPAFVPEAAAAAATTTQPLALPSSLHLNVHTKLSVRRLRKLVASRLTMERISLGNDLSDSNQSIKSLTNLASWASTRHHESNSDLDGLDTTGVPPVSPRSHHQLNRQGSNDLIELSDDEGTGESTGGTRPELLPSVAVDPRALRLERWVSNQDYMHLDDTTLHCTMETAGLTRPNCTLLAALSLGEPHRDDRAMAPSVADSLSEQHMQVLFDLLRCGAATLVEHVWSVLQLVPSSRSMLTQCCHPAALAWADVLPSRLPYFEQQADAAASLTTSGADAAADAADATEREERRRAVAAGQIFQAVYVLQLMDSVLLPGDCVDAVPSAAAVECRSEFVRAGGAAAVHGFFVALGPPSPWRAPLGGLPDPLSHAVRMALGLCLKVLMVCLQDPVLQPPAPSLSMCEAEAVKSTTTAIGQASETATLAPALPPLDFRRTQLKLCTVLGSAHAFLRGTERAAASHAEAHDEASAIMVEALKCLGIVLVTHASHDAAGFLVNKDVQSLLTDMLLCNPVTSVRDQTFQLLQNLTQLGQEHRRCVFKLLTDALPSVTLERSSVWQYFQNLIQMVQDPCTSVSRVTIEAMVGTLLQKLRAVPRHDGCRMLPQEGMVGALVCLTSLFKTYPVVGQALSAGDRGTAIVELLLDELLYTMPEATTDGSGSHHATTTIPAQRLVSGGRLCLTPKCFGQRARTAARNLLKEVLRLHLGDNAAEGGGGSGGSGVGMGDSGRLLGHVVRRLSALHAACPEAESWSENPSHDPGPRNITGFCGLTNQGSTCYLNSTLQQLYMIPSLRRGLMSVAVPRPPDLPDPAATDVSPSTSAAVVARTGDGDAGASVETESQGGPSALLWNLQRVLHLLDGGTQRFVDPRELVVACARELRLAHPVLFQNDAQEFVDQLLGKLEAQLKGTPQENLLRWCFGGVLCHQCFAQAPHGDDGSGGGRGGSGGGGGGALEVLRKPDVAEPFLFLELAVKSKANLVESLMDFVKEEQVEGLQWDGHPQGLPSIKRTCIRTLPQCLLFNLKRYEFNLVTLTRDKVNDYYAFPDVVDMWPYTEEGLAAAAERPHSHAHAQSSCSQSRDAGQRQQYLYRLRGVVVQSGTEKSGHYYSYIQDRTSGVWYKFNDQTVSIFDAAMLAHECFGGTERVTVKRAMHGGQQCDVTKERPVTRSAYMLLYERAEGAEGGPPPPQQPASSTRGDAEDAMAVSPCPPCGVGGGDSGTVSVSGMAAGSEAPGGVDGGNSELPEVRVIREEVYNTNAAFLRSVQVLDPEHIDLVREMVALVVQQKRQPLPAAEDDTQPQQANSAGGDGVQEALDHATALMATEFFRRRVMRWEERGGMQLKHWTAPLTMLYMRAPSQLCCTVLRGLCDVNTLRSLLLECPDQPSRQAFQSLLASAMQRVHAVEGAGIDEKLLRVAALPSDQRKAALDGLMAGSALIQFVNTLLALLRELPLGTHVLRSDELLLLLNEATLVHHRLSVDYLRQREAATALAEVFMSNGMDTSLSTQGCSTLMITIHNLVIPPFWPALQAAGFEKTAPQPLNEPAAAEAVDTAAAEAAEAVDQASLVARELPEHCSPLLNMPPFLNKAVLRGQNSEVAARLCAAACVCKRDMSVRLITLLVPSLTESACVDVLARLLELRDGDQLQSERADVLLGGEGGLLLAARHAATKKQDQRCVLLIFALHSLATRSPTATEWLKMRRLEWEWMCGWLRNHDAGMLWKAHVESFQGALVALQKEAFEQYGDGVLELEEDQLENQQQEDSDDSDDVTEVVRPRSPQPWSSCHSRELEDQLARKLTDMNIPDAHAWARKAVTQVRPSVRKEALNDAVSWVLTQQQQQQGRDDDDVYDYNFNDVDGVSHDGTTPFIAAYSPNNSDDVLELDDVDDDEEDDQ